MIELYSDKYGLTKLKVGVPKAYGMKKYDYKRLKRAVEYRRSLGYVIDWVKVGDAVFLTAK